MSEPSESFPGLSGGIKSHAARVIVTRLAGSVGEYENARLMDAVCEVIMRDPPSRIVIEMSRVTECDQQLVATLVLCKDLARDAGSELVIARPSADALALIRGAQLERSIRVYPDESSAVSVEPETLDPLQPVPQARAQDDSDVAGVVDPVIDSITGFFSPHYMRRWLSDAGENARCACSMVLLELPASLDGETPPGSLLISTGELLFDSLRPVDVVVHLGAGRFALLLPRTTEQEGLRIVAGLEAALGRLLQQSPGSKQGMPMLRNTVVNCASANSGIEELISMARERLVDAPWHRVEVGKPLGSEEARRELSQDLRRMLATLGSLEQSLAQPYPALLSDTPQDLLSVARSIFEFLDYNYSPTQLIHDPRLEARAQRFAGQLAKQLGALAQDVEPAINLRL